MENVFPNLPWTTHAFGNASCAQGVPAWGPTLKMTLVSPISGITGPQGQHPHDHGSCLLHMTFLEHKILSVHLKYLYLSQMIFEDRFGFQGQGDLSN